MRIPHETICRTQVPVCTRPKCTGTPANSGSKVCPNPGRNPVYGCTKKAHLPQQSTLRTALAPHPPRFLRSILWGPGGRQSPNPEVCHKSLLGLGVMMSCNFGVLCAGLRCGFRSPCDIAVFGQLLDHLDHMILWMPKGMYYNMSLQLLLRAL